jgi:very-short-patch-repair endonuclease
MEPDVIHLVGGGIVSSPAQTLFEISHETDDRTLLSAFEDCVNRDLATVAEIRAFGSRVIKMGRPGSARFRRVILGRPDELPFAMSHPELVLAKALEADDSRWRRQHRLLLPGGTAAYIDVARPEIKLGVEVDGAVHESPLAIASDKRRDVMAAQIGWHILRCTTDDVQSHLRSLVAQILEAAKARQSQFPGPRT